MFALPESFAISSQKQFESQLTILNSYTSTIFDSMQKIADLNSKTAQASLQESQQATQHTIQAKDAQTFLALHTKNAQSTTEKMLAYSRQLATITGRTQVQLIKTADTHSAETSDKVSTLIDALGNNIPAGSEPAIAFLKRAIGNANTGYTQLSQAAKQAAETLEAHLNTATDSFPYTAEKKTRRTRTSA